ncbi:MAG: DUF2800 domain-containing protein [Faecousia sp.]
MSELKDHSSRAHALLSASSSDRWLKCPPSAVAASIYPSADTVYTREGTLAHEVAEALARGASVDVSSPDITTEMLRCAEEYADYIREQVKDDGAVVLLEQRLDFSPWVPGGFGTGDCIILQGRRLDVIDYKYGQGVAVSAVGNTQMRLYGLGALNDFGYIYDVDEVTLHIFQPRMNNVSVEPLTREVLLAWGEEIKPIAALAAKGEGEMSSGPHCRFCPHAGVCPELAMSCLMSYDASGGKVAVPTMPRWMMSTILEEKPVITAWLKAVEDRALADLLEGRDVPGFKVVEGKLGNRKWSDEKKVSAALDAAGYGPDEYTETLLLSPAKMDKALGKKKVSELLSDLIDRSPGAPTVVPLSDKRKPLDRLAEAKKDFET